MEPVIYCSTPDAYSESIIFIYQPINLIIINCDFNITILARCPRRRGSLLQFLEQPQPRYPKSIKEIKSNKNINLKTSLCFCEHNFCLNSEHSTIHHLFAIHYFILKFNLTLNSSIENSQNGFTRSESAGFLSNAKGWCHGKCPMNLTY